MVPKYYLCGPAKKPPDVLVADGLAALVSFLWQCTACIADAERVVVQGWQQAAGSDSEDLTNGCLLTFMYVRMLDAPHQPPAYLPHLSASRPPAWLDAHALLCTCTTSDASHSLCPGDVQTAPDEVLQDSLFKQVLGLDHSRLLNVHDYCACQMFLICLKCAETISAHHSAFAVSSGAEVCTQAMQ